MERGEREGRRGEEPKMEAEKDDPDLYGLKESQVVMNIL